jgi:DNA-binding MarR family transcriptional regulator
MTTRAPTPQTVHEAKAPRTQKPKKPQDYSDQWVTDGVQQYADLLESTDPASIAVQLALWRANHAQYVANSRAIDALGLPVSITGSRLAVMRTLYCAPGKNLSLSAISRAANISPTMVTNLIDGLARGGLVRRDGSPHDRRVSIACLTKEGEETFHKVLPIMSERMTEACAGFSDEEKQTLLTLLQRLF